MKFGISSYSLHQAMNEGKMTILDMIAWAKKQGAEHVEIVPLGFDLINQPDLINQIKEKAEIEAICLSNYAIGADFLKSGQALKDEIERVKTHVDIMHQLGIKHMRHDVGFLEPEEATTERFQADLERIVLGCREVADYAQEYQITTSLENHGYYIQHSDRVRTIIESVNRPNFKLTLDVGNFLCVDEDPVVAVKKSLPYMSMLHLKDFYYRKTDQSLGLGFFPTKFGHQLRGAITGQGDVDLCKILKLVKQVEYDGFVSIEFEGIEDCQMGTKQGLDLMKSLYKVI
ncbi:sugar phosphate isomerase/epimerase family protein [Amphibacillus jilinensis]|uniref:sugar phosphate isomerase/epimerase family protein n=1 Tax=Amphibacillus jilinensis TaxID=1216008 RepID=UPI0002F4321A|nr:sugar phosphate isomerase/epimerase family protein [Amphibacillus jilinensis]